MFKIVYWNQGESPSDLMKRATALQADIAITPIATGTKWYAISSLAVKTLSEAPMQLPRMNSATCKDTFISSESIESVKKKIASSDKFQVVS